MSVTLVHPTKADGWNEMPFGRDTHVAQRNIVLDRDLRVKGRFGDRIGDRNSTQNLHYKLRGNIYRYRNGYHKQPIGTQQALCNGTIADPIRFPLPNLGFFFFSFSYK